MAYSEFWNPKNETLPRDQLQALQLLKLRRLCEWAYANTAFHKRRFDAAGFKPEQLQTLDDIRRIPFMTREAWMEGQLAHPMFGDLLATDQANAIRYHLTSGTTGRTPIRVLDSMKDWDWIAEMWCYGLWGFGVRPEDTVYFAFGYGSFIGFWGAHYCCEKIGALVIPGGAQTTEARVKQIVEMGATVVCSTPTYALTLWQKARELGIDLAKESKVNKIILSGEPAGSIPAVKRQLEDAWGAKCGDTAGMTELGTIMIFECSHQPGGTHIIEDHFIEEVIHPDTEGPADYGELGERVVTSFGRGFIPVIRYRTKDMVLKVPASACDCARTWDMYEGGIRGRWDDMKLIRGTNVYPRAVEAIIREYAAIDEFQIYVWHNDLQDEITIKLDIKPGFEAEWADLQIGLAKDLSQAHEGLRFNIERIEYGTLPRFELKAKRLVDARPVAKY
ncbi:MAG TPA: phenylacetate--CoA ligase family protein [Ktedonobacterales bacterium]|jgi:phenylacetate-CoA ligase